LTLLEASFFKSAMHDLSRSTLCSWRVFPLDYLFIDELEAYPIDWFKFEKWWFAAEVPVMFVVEYFEKFMVILIVVCHW